MVPETLQLIVDLLPTITVVGFADIVILGLTTIGTGMFTVIVTDLVSVPAEFVHVNV